MTETCPRCSRMIEFLGETPSFCMYCGQPLSSSTLLSELTIDLQKPDDTFVEPDRRVLDPKEVPDSVAGFKLIRKLGEGGMGSVHEAEDSVSGRRVAIKLISPHLLGSEIAVERFLQEGRLASAIAHPRCVFVLGADEEYGRPYIVMELMQGSTLKDLVTQVGPLPPEQAVAKILDVIDGLREAHRLGVLHRDVKPSNCFLEEDGRVKIGDFGLSKSLSRDMNLTRTGSFLGTPLYASPEQIKGDPLDARADVYSVAATLYFLLSGMAPFEGGNAESTLAKIVTLSAPSIRGLVPDIPRALDAVILKGLERNRERRYRDLDELSEALLPFLPNRLSITGAWIRLAAFMGDFVVTKLLGTIIFNLMYRFETGHVAPATQRLALGVGLDLLFWGGFFVLAEGLTGSSPFKFLLHMKVYCQDRATIPGLGRSLKRTLILYAFVELPATIYSAYMAFHFDQGGGLIAMGLRFVGVAVACSSMRSSNGFRGLHELRSDTRVVLLPSRRQVASPGVGRWPRREWTLASPPEMPRELGSYEIEGAIRWDHQIRILQAIDTGLGRHSWILLRPENVEPLSAWRQETDRMTRPRWLAAGTFDDWRWDAMVAPVGRPLGDLVSPRNPISWQETRQILEALAEELEESIAAQSLPEHLSVGQVFVQPDGRIQLIDEDPMRVDITFANQGDNATRSIMLLHEIAMLALTGKVPTKAGDTRIAGSIPLHARAILDRLKPGPKRYSSTTQLLTDLKASRDLTTEITTTGRLIRAGIFMGELFASLVLASIPVGTVMTAAALSSEMENEQLAFTEVAVKTIERYVAILPIVIPLVWVVWALATKGGITRPLLGFGLARPDGKPITRLRCALREGLIWGFVALIFHLALWPTLDPLGLPFESEWLLLILPIYAAWGIFSGRRMPHELLSGTIVVPK